MDDELNEKNETDLFASSCEYAGVTWYIQRDQLVAYWLKWEN